MSQPIQILYRLSEKGRKESLRAGGDGKEKQSVQVPHVSAEYVAALDLVTVATDGSAEIDTYDRRYADGSLAYDGPHTFYDAPQSAARLIADEAARRTARTAAREEKQRADDEKTRQDTITWCALPLAERVEKRYSTWEPTWAPAPARETTEYVETVAECQRRNDEAQTARDLMEAQAKARAEAGLSALRLWAEKHGSLLLRARLEDGYTWAGLAVREYCDCVADTLLDGYQRVEGMDDYSEDSRDDRTTPTLEEITAIRALRERISEAGENAIVDCAMQWVKYTPNVDPDDYPDDDAKPVSRTEIRITIYAPTGDTTEYDVLPAPSTVTV